MTFILSFKAATAQELSFQQADSTSEALFQAGEWHKLLHFGARSIHDSIDFPALRLRLGYADFVTENYHAALKQYHKILKQNAYDQTARYFSYWSHLYLNQDQGAAYDAAYMDADQLKAANMRKFDFISAGLESGIKFSDNYYRGNAYYNRFSLSNRLSWRLQLDQSIAYFTQSIDNRRYIFLNNNTGKKDNQFEYYAKLSYAITENMRILGAYHYLNTNFLNITYNSNIGLAGLQYNGTYINLQGDINWGSMIKNYLIQYNAAVSIYPFGNFNLYTISRASYLHQNGAGQAIFNQSAGFKFIKNIWLETSATFGNQDNYIDKDGLYIYNSIDRTKLKLGETAFFQLSKQVQLQLNYAYEKKLDETHSLSYGQHAVTTGILWRF
ncbi:hypothetical protein [Mucilaginibacter sp.]|uniref:hypothetical protein n=1 Tax=Mucilaginibacter sp. TaxID=1882438 RepID=UPI003D1170A9